MIPSTVGFLDDDFEIEEETSRTYQLEQNAEKVYGYTDGILAVKQAAFKILNTERYQHIIYSWDYGVETMDLYGEPVSYVCPELERRITDALTQDSRITEVTDFEFEIKEKGSLHALFKVHTIFGTLQMEREVNI